MGHGQGAGLMLLAVDLAVDLVARAAGAGHAPSTLTAVGATSLGHEARDHSMEGQAVVKAFLGQFHEVGHGIGSIGLEQFQLDAAGIGIHQGLGHGCWKQTATSMRVAVR